MFSRIPRACVASRMLLHIVHLWIYSLLFLQLCTGLPVNCTVTRDGRQTHYVIQEFKATSCHYRWTNETDYSLANHKGKMNELVEINTNRTLVISGCLESVRYTRDCISEEISREANCTTSCTKKIEPQRGEGITHHHWIILAVVFIILLFSVGYKLRKTFSAVENADACENAEQSPPRGRCGGRAWIGRCFFTPLQQV